MEVILSEEVAHLGTIGDVVKVKPGYARNYLLPRGLALLADKRNVKQLEHRKRVVEGRRQRVLNLARSAAEKISSLKIVLRARAGDEGKLFGSVTNIDLEKALISRGITVERRRIRVAEPIKQLGEHKVSVHLGVGVDAEFTVLVEAVEAEEATSASSAEAVAEKTRAGE